MTLSLLGIDPSFAGTGLCKIDVGSKTIHLGLVRTKSGWVKDFAGSYRASVETVKSIIFTVESWSSSFPNFLITETPPPNGQFAAALYGLDVLLCSALLARPGVDELYSVPPNFLDHVHGTRKNTTKWHADLGKKLLEVYRVGGYSVNYRRGTVVSADEGAAIVFTSRLFVRLLPKSQTAAGLVHVAGNLFNDKETRIGPSLF